MAKTDDSETLASVMARDIAARIRDVAAEFNNLVDRAESRGIEVETVLFVGGAGGKIVVRSVTLRADL